MVKPPLDSSFLPGPQRIAPHLADRVWARNVDREESHALESKGDWQFTRNPITGELPKPLRLGAHDGVLLINRGSNGNSCAEARAGSDASSTCAASVRSSRSSRRAGSARRGVAFTPRCGTAASSAAASRCGTSQRLGTAGSAATASSLCSAASSQPSARSSARSAASDASRMSSVLSLKLQAERLRSEAVEKENALLREELAKMRGAGDRVSS
eukprot:TRINITY_DN57960_c0_g1_i1.p1 TRINITY_DN57960_c0_g1~~TRINITY_DN57960_c0_g1_i1.p1  ORF type:complete len:214 (+),score=47.28 TRINITY_DN57960_c0_g1_i1:71-712(+)